jgi:hypothetical protein
VVHCLTSFCGKTMSAHLSFPTRPTHPVHAAHIEVPLEQICSSSLLNSHGSGSSADIRFKEQLCLQPKFFNTGAFIGYLVFNSKTGRYMLLVRYNQNWNSSVTSIKSGYHVTGIVGDKAKHLSLFYSLTLWIF